jgi:hypothetical protein
LRDHALTAEELKDWLAVSTLLTPPVSGFSLVIWTMMGSLGGKRRVELAHNCADYWCPDYGETTVWHSCLTIYKYKILCN